MLASNSSRGSVERACATHATITVVVSLLLSPDVFDFTKPVTVVADGRTVFEGLVKNDVAKRGEHKA